jgi:hypothetical protein
MTKRFDHRSFEGGGEYRNVPNRLRGAQASTHTHTQIVCA